MPGKARTYHHGDLRKALLVAAEAELTEKGVEGFTLRGCAKRAGVSHAAPAHHFRDAGALLAALVTEGFERFAAAMRKRQAGETDARERLVGAGLGYLDFALANPALFRLMFSSARPDPDDPALKAAGTTAFGVLLEAIRDLDGSDPEQDRDAMLDVAVAWSAVHGLSHLLLSGRLQFLEEIADGNLGAVHAEVIRRLLPKGPAAD
jgi:AcrR family transcriptional regulator